MEMILEMIHLNVEGEGEIVVNLEELASNMESMDFCKIFLNIMTGEYVTFSEEYLSEAEEITGEADLEGYMDWERKEIREILDMENNWEDYRSLPSKFEIDEYSIMEDFIALQKDRRKGDKLERAIRGKGAFRRFKDTVQCLNIEEDWYDFRWNTFLEIARSWCEEKNLCWRMGDRKST